MSVKVDRFARRLEKVEKHGIATAIQPRLPYSTLDGGAITVTDQVSGEVRGYFGQQWDGTTTASSVGGPPPPPPTMPLVTPRQGGLALYWDGTFVDDSPTRMDWKRVTLHAMPVGIPDGVADPDDFDPLNPAQVVGEITIATGGEIFATLPPVEHYIFAVTWTEAGKFSMSSDPTLGTPLSLVDEAEWQAHEEALEQINNIALPGLQEGIDGVATNLAESTATIESSLEQLQEDLAAIGDPGDIGPIGDLVTIINNATRTRHGIY